MSMLARLWNSIRSPVRFIGRDLQGNTYHEAPQPNDPSRPKRFVQYKEQGDVWNHIAGQKRIPVQWSSWLTYTRAHPPTLEELQADVERQQRVLANVARIQARDRAEEEEMLKIRQRDAQQALLDAASVHIRTVQETETDTLDAAAQPPSTSTSSAKASQTSTPTPSEQPTVLPPTFLTPSTPRRAKKSTGKLRLPPMDFDAASNAASAPESVKESASATAPTDKSKAAQKEVPYAPSKPLAETESWTPKAIRRGQ